MGARFSAPVQTGPGAHPASCTMGSGSFPVVESGLGVTLTPHPLLVPWSRKGRVIPLLPLWAVRPVRSLSACTRVHFTFYFFDIKNHCLPIQCFMVMFPASKGLALWNYEHDQRRCQTWQLKMLCKCDIGDPHGSEVFRDVTVGRALNRYGRFGGAYQLQLYSLAVGSTILLSIGNRLNWYSAFYP